MSKQIINEGHTNISYKDSNKFIQEKKLTGFNHKINYEILNKFDFVPKLIENNDKESIWEFIEGKHPDLSSENLIKIAKLLKILHNSKLKFPASNHASRVKKYLQIIKEKGIKKQVLNDYYKQITTTLAKMDKNIPSHNDLWLMNILEDKKNKLFICDWEYATMGDKNFDLAYFIESANLTSEQEDVFLNEYDDYNYIYVLRHKILVNYLVILWVLAQDVLHFDPKPYEERIYVLDKELKERLNKK
ncbi:PTS lichenan-specific IIA component domain protein [Mycoplasmopsis maculosa]|uniref:PTS lichenan-specific IIA component domain protein n=1 Tax=Mycoplasmopsis maculosa TaxID=114885 RepID=A0A449B5F9_9BACT|nr:phosphotransferase [Mycoplasmopsis maculosa]VEU75805.1 PTS lichenan-specific IIA component domain protein [Mycoplasmopsis maculosa]